MTGYSLGKTKFVVDFGNFPFGVNKEVVGTHALPTRSLFACDILRRLLRRVSFSEIDFCRFCLSGVAGWTSAKFQGRSAPQPPTQIGA